MVTPGDLQGLGVLIVEDEFLLAMTLAEDLEAEGCIIVGPFHRLEVAREAAARATFDIALLDINLNGTMVFPLAEDLIARKLPFIFVSGYGETQIPHDFRRFRRVAKPHDLQSLTTALRQESGRWPVPG